MIKKNILTTIIVTIIAVIFFPLLVKATELELDLDIVFVLASERTDTAVVANMIVDMQTGSDSRAGFIAVSDGQVVWSGFRELISFSRDVKNEMTNLRTENASPTSIEAMTNIVLDLFAPNNLADIALRRSVLAFIGDGVELDEETLAFAIQAGIEVISINLQLDLLEQVTTAYGVLIGARPMQIFQGDTAIVTSSVLDGNIHKSIFTILGSNLPEITVSHDGVDLVHQINNDQSSRYAVITIIAPYLGEITIELLASRQIQVNRIDVYDFSVVLDMPRTEVEKAEFTWRLQQGTLTINDPNLINHLSPTLTIRDTNGMETEYTFLPGQTSKQVVLPAGRYFAFVTIDDIGIIRTSTGREFAVPAAPSFELLMSNIDINLTTIFSESVSLVISDIVRYSRENLPLEVIFEVWQGDDIVLFEFDADANEIHLRAETSGNAQFLVSIYDLYGNSISFIVNARVIEGAVFVFAAIAMVVVTAAVLVIVKIRKRPLLNSSMRSINIKMNLPQGLNLEYPPAIPLMLPSQKNKISLMELLKLNTSTARPYDDAIMYITKAVESITFEPKSGAVLSIRVPSNKASSFVYSIDDDESKQVADIDKFGHTKIGIVHRDNTIEYKYGIILGYFD